MNSEQYQFIKDSQENHWWYKGRRDVIRSLLDATCSGFASRRVLDVGAGFGSMLSVLLLYGPVDAVELFEEAHPELKVRGANRVFKSLGNIEPAKQYDMITMFDVLEHMENEDIVLNDLKQNLNDSGKLILTVPAYNWLWSSHDTENDHFRRYTRNSLTDILENNGYHIEKSGYFMTILFPFAVLERLLLRRLKMKRLREKSESSTPNRLFYFLFSLERKLIKYNLLKYGMSTYAVVSKKSS